MASSLLSAAVRSSGEATASICAKSNSGCLLQNAADCTVESCKGELTMLIFPFLALLIGTIAMPLSRMVKLPYTLLLLFVGIVLGLLGCGVDMALLSTSLRQWVHLNPPQIFFYVFLAPLIFEAAFNTQLHVFKRVLIPILTLAFIVVVIQAGLIAAFQKLVVRTADWTWWAALMFGAMLSATDPISVTATLKSVGASETLGTLIEGESLLNDGSAFVLWEAFFENTVDESAKSVGEIVIDIFRLSIGGALMGVAFGLLAMLVLSFVYDEFEVETSITVVVAFLGFWTAQAPSRLSGVICNVASGLLLSALGRPLISPAVRGPLAEFWELLAWIANTIVFVHAGVLSSGFVWSCSGEPHGASDYLFILAYFLFLQVIRLGLIGIFFPLLRTRNSWFTWKEALVVGASGLRGAVSLILALEVGSTAAVPENVRSRVVLWTTGIVVLSLVFNGLIVKPLLHALKLDKADKTREDFLRRARSLVIQRTLMILDSLAIEGSLKQARWSYVAENVLPMDWLEEEEHLAGYEEAVEHLGQGSTGNRASLELVENEARKHQAAGEMVHRLSLDMINAGQLSPGGSPGTPLVTSFSYPGLSPTGSPRIAGRSPLYQHRSSISYSASPSPMNVGVPDTGDVDGALVLGANAMGDIGVLDAATPSMNFKSMRYSRDPSGVQRNSIEQDLLRFGRKSVDGGMSTELEIHREITALHKSLAQGQPLPAYTEKDREVRRRMLTSMLAKVRAISNATFAEFAVLVNLDEDIQEALDANESCKDYDLYDLLDRRGLKQSKWYHRWARLLTERQSRRGETSISIAHVVIIMLTHVLKEDFMHDSALVYFEAESLYEGAATLLNRMETIHPQAVAWVESQFAVQITFSRQDGVLDDMLAHGSLDEHERNVLLEELISVRRRHFLYTSRRSSLPPKPTPRELLKHHDLFRGLSQERKTSVVQGLGKLHHLRSGQLLDTASGDLVVVLDGAVRPVATAKIPEPRDLQSPSRQSHGHVESSSDVDDAVCTSGARQGDALQFKSGGTMHWCYPIHNTVCGPDLALAVGNTTGSSQCKTLLNNLQNSKETRLRCCEVAGKATVWTLPVRDVKSLARRDEAFRTEITRSLARQMVLESISDLPPYSLSHVQEALAGVHDEYTVIGRATKLLERLPYMSIVALRPMADKSPALVYGPGILLNGTVRVSIVDSSGLVGAVNLLHEELTGPALLPVGGLIIEEVRSSSSDDLFGDGAGPVDRPFLSPTPPPSSAPHSTHSSQPGLDHMPSASSDNRFMALAAEAASIALLDNDTGGDTGTATGPPAQEKDGKDDAQPPLRSAFAHILIEEMLGTEDEMGSLALKRLKRWTGDPVNVDMNGRHAIIRHVSLNKAAGAAASGAIDTTKALAPEIGESEDSHLTPSDGASV